MANDARVGSSRAPVPDGATRAHEAPGPAPAPREPVVMVTEEAALAVVARAGGALGTMLDPATPWDADNASLASRAPWESVARVLEGDVKEVAERDTLAGVGVARYAHRLFDSRWLRAKSARFELVGIIPRLDRRAFFDDACGEIRLVYRLAYGGSASVGQGGMAERSRLPMTVSLELQGAPRAEDGGCVEAARRWLAPAGLKGAPLGRWLVSADGPLHAGALTRARLAQLVVNVQRVRWPSAVRPDLGGHAEYVLRAFEGRAAGAPLTPAPLENTPDVERLRSSPASRAELLAQLLRPDVIERVDEGTVRLPTSLLARRVISVTPGGLERRANRPFASLFEPRELESATRASSRHAKSGAALLRRLDDLTCNGCHASRSIAGFHLLGDNRADDAPGNMLAVPFSPHEVDEVDRRRAFMRALADGLIADDHRPLAAPEREVERYARGAVGDACEPSSIEPHRDPHRDRARKEPAQACLPGLHCERTAVGFPRGMCSGGCDAVADGARCGGIAVLDPFNACVARKEPFSRCITEHVRPAALAACSIDSPCRDDYVCAGAPDEGTCLPPYFVFQLRVDGHPAP